MITSPCFAKDADSFKEAAKATAGEDLAHLYRNFCRAEPNKAHLTSQSIAAQYVFDNLVFLGRGKWNSWALVTDAGIMLFDAMETEQEAQHYIVEGLQQVGLDPRDIRKVFIMHGHGDHFGGARLIQSRYGAEVYASEADWALMDLTREVSARREDDRDFTIVQGNRIRYLTAGQTVPEKQHVITDAMSVSLGSTSVTFYLTPGHTKGTVSAILPLQSGTQTLYGGYWGGTGFTAPGTNIQHYQQSLLYFSQQAKAAGVSVPLSNHPTSDMMLARMSALGTPSAAQHPFDIGEKGYQRLLKVLDLCLLAYQEKEIK